MPGTRGWPSIRLRFLFTEFDERVGAPSGDVPLLSVSIHRGVLPRTEMTELESRADDFTAYKRVAAGDIVVNRMRAFEGGAGISPVDGMVSSDYAVLRPGARLDGRYLHHLIRSRWFVGEMIARLRGIGNIEVGNVRTPRINVDDLGDIRIGLPDRREQRAIADYLDAEVARIDSLAAVRRRSVDLARERFAASVWWATTKGVTHGPWRGSGLEWVGGIPAHWGTPAVGLMFEVQLGKMLNSDATASGKQHPYLRNENVQWDRIDLDDLNRMHFDAADRLRYGLRNGDLLVCEGGEVGRAAMWRGELPDCYYQKALHRVRARRSGNVRFLMYVLRAARERGVFTTEGNTSTIVHLTAEKLRSHRFPCPPTREQDNIVEFLDREAARIRVTEQAVERQIALLTERRQALITAAVTGHLEIPGVAA